MADLKQAVANYLNAVDAFRQFEKDFPNNSTKAWDNLLYAQEFAENDLRTAYRADPVEPVAEPAPAPKARKGKKVAEPFALMVEQGGYVRTKESARLMRAILSESFPKTKFSIRSHSYSMGSHVSVSWEDGPTRDQVDAVIGEIRGRDFNGMDDSYTYVSHKWAGETIHFSGSGSSTNRSMSDLLRDTMKISDLPYPQRDEAYRSWHTTSLEETQPSPTLALFQSFQKDAA